MLDFEHKAVFDNFILDAKTQIPVSGMTALFGSSGSGKTSLLRSIAGFDHTDGYTYFNGEIWFDSDRKIDIPPHRRPASLVFQKPLLFSHLNVLGNLNYPLNHGRNRIGEVRIEAAIETFDLEDLLLRRVVSLSGGEIQRVALARALLVHPELLLLDEPLSGLDDRRKAEILPYLKRISSEFRLPTIYVSHGLDELVSICDHMLVIDNGKIVDEGETQKVFERLNVSHLAGRLEAGSLITGTLRSHDDYYQLSRLDVQGNTVEVPIQPWLKPGDLVQLKVRARDVALATSKPDNLSIRNVLSGRIVGIDLDEDSPYAECDVEIGSTVLRARITRASIYELRLDVGVNVFALIKSVSFD